MKPNLIVSNIGYVPLAAGARLGIPAFGLGSLDWLTMLRGFPTLKDPSFLGDIEAAYSSAHGLPQITPTVAHAPWQSRITLGAVAAQGRARREELRRLFGGPPNLRVA